MLKRLTNGEFALAVLVASLFWIAVLVWATSYAPTDPEKKACYQAAEKFGRSTEECKSFWEKTTSDPVAMFTLVLAFSTVGLWTATIGLYLAGERQLAHAQSESEAAEFYRKVQYDQISDQIVALQQSANAAEEAARASAEQAYIARAALTQLERPYVFVFGVRQVREDPDSHEFFVEYTVVNYGKMPAIIEGAWVDFVPDSKGDPPIPPLLDESHSLLSSPILQSGERRENIRAYAPAGMTKGSSGVIVNVKTGAEAACPDFDVPEGFDIFFRATIRYHGPSSAGHETGALWLYNPSSFEFAQRGEEYNYTK